MSASSLLDPRKHQYKSGKKTGKKGANTGATWNRLLQWASGAPQETFRRQSPTLLVILTEVQRSWSVYAPTAISHWLKAAPGRVGGMNSYFQLA